jgi:hypothetical protein
MDYKKNSLSSFAREKLLKKIAFFFAVAVFIGAAGTGFVFAERRVYENNAR